MVGRQMRFRRWMEKHRTPEMMRQAERLSLRRDMITLLEYVQENKVVGTQSTGNMPLKAVREVTARFVDPTVLDSRIGDRVYRLRSEADIWPLHFLHILADVGGMIRIAPARRWQVTADGERFLDRVPLLQTSYLLTVWWHSVNWLVAYPLEGMGEQLPRGFGQVTLKHLLALPVGEQVRVEEFADKLIEETGLTWSVQFDGVQRALRGSIRRMIVGILASFGGVEREFQEKPLGKGTVSELFAFEVTPFGRALLEGAAIFEN